MSAIEISTTPSRWVDDVLNRDKSAEFLTKYLNEKYSDEQDVVYKDSFVLNINSGWGVGKTFFLLQWKKDLEDLKHPVVYFDAWKNDFTNNPLIGFISEFNEELNKYKQKHDGLASATQDLVESAKKLTSLVSKVAVNIAVKTLGIPDEILDGNILSDSIEKQSHSKDLIDQHIAIKKEISHFKQELKEFIEKLRSENKAQAPLYIFVDELDRCRPNYAIELLENIKHFFGVKGVYFVVATNTQELNHSVKAIYGAGFDSNMYLKRFFDQEYTLPKPNYFQFAKHIMKNNRIFNNDKIFIPSLNVTENIEITFSVLSQAFGLTLRDQEQVASRVKSVLLVSNLNKVHFLFLVFLTILNLKNKDHIESIALGNKLTTSPLYEGNLTFVKVHEYNGKGYYEVAISISVVIGLYLNIMWSRKADIYQSVSDSSEVNKAIMAEVIKELRNSSDNQMSSLSRYPELVMQAGYLS